GAARTPTVAGGARRVGPPVQATIRANGARPPARTSSGRAAQTIVSEPNTASFAENSLVHGAIRSGATRPTETAYARRPRLVSGIVRGSVIMKKRKTRTS